MLNNIVDNYEQCGQHSIVVQENLAKGRSLQSNLAGMVKSIVQRPYFHCSIS